MDLTQQTTAQPVAERAILAGLHADCFAPAENATEQTLDELEALLETAGGVCVARLLQNRHTPDSHTFFGEGKADELRQLAETEQAQLLICDNDLSPSQIRALEEATGVTVMDRSALILDIFAQRARTREGRLQVELAQYQYLLPRLAGMGQSLSRLGGGIGTRGPGETKLETDRRHIRERITRLKQELEEVRRVRAVQRQRRQKNAIPVVALVGYTNAGKSTVLNALTGAGIPANDRLFDTLDTTTRRLQVSDQLAVLLSDTVGFIAKLPHHLVEAFHATLEELAYADLLIHVVDSADPELEAHQQVVLDLIAQLARPGVPVITAYNKTDLAEAPYLAAGADSVAICAKTGQGLEELLARMEQTLSGLRHQVTLLLPYSQGGQLDRLHQQAQVLSVDYESEGIRVCAVVDEAQRGRLRDYLVDGT